MLRKIKERLTQTMQKKKKTGVTKDIPREEKKEISSPAQADGLGRQETIIEKTKFYTPEATKAQRQIPQDLPYQYTQNRIVLQVRDPWWIHAYWETKQDTLEKLRVELKDEFYKAKRVLRVYDISHIIFDGKNAHRFFDIQINEHANNWYIDTGGPGRSWCVDLGLLLPSGRFITMLRSNTVHTPLDGPSWITDEEWMIPEDMFARLYGMGIGMGSSPVKVKKLWEEKLKREMGSGALFSISSPARKAQERKFWLSVNTELIVYGASEPDALVSVQGRQIKLRPDGTFSLRFALPEGKQVIPVKAVSSDNQEERTITPIVTKETH